jgi:hypothetical protein
MSEITETNSKEAAVEHKSFVTPNFEEIMDEAIKYAAYGWVRDKTRPPFYNFFLYEVHMIRTAATVAAAKANLEGGEGAREPITKEKRQEIMANARKAKKINKDKEDTDEGAVQ